MRRIDLTKLTVEQLVDRFAEIGIAQDDALWGRKYAKFNRLFDRMNEVGCELRARGIEARRALVLLFDHRNRQVRLQAAKWILGVEPVRARKVIEDISKSGFYPQAGDAGMTLVALDDGTFEPD